jgi:hypothetical protein
MPAVADHVAAAADCVELPVVDDQRTVGAHLLPLDRRRPGFTPGAHGLVCATGWNDETAYPGPVLVVPTPADAAALVTLELAAVAPTNPSDIPAFAAALAVQLADCDADRGSYFVGPEAWASRAAQALAAALPGRRVRRATPPHGCSSARSSVDARLAVMTDDETLAELGSLFYSQLSLRAASGPAVAGDGPECAPGDSELMATDPPAMEPGGPAERAPGLSGADRLGTEGDRDDADEVEDRRVAAEGEQARAELAAAEKARAGAPGADSAAGGPLQTVCRRLRTAYETALDAVLRRARGREEEYLILKVRSDWRPSRGRRRADRAPDGRRGQGRREGRWKGRGEGGLGRYAHRPPRFAVSELRLRRRGDHRVLGAAHRRRLELRQRRLAVPRRGATVRPRRRWHEADLAGRRERVFAWAARQVLPKTRVAEQTVEENKLTWSEKSGLVTKKEFFAHLQQTATEFDSVESYPHQPPLDGCYHLHQMPTGGDGKALAELLSMLCPATETDRHLLRAALMTAPYGAEDRAVDRRS